MNCAISKSFTAHRSFVIVGLKSIGAQLLSQPHGGQLYFQPQDPDFCWRERLSPSHPNPQLRGRHFPASASPVPRSSLVPWSSPTWALEAGAHVREEVKRGEERRKKDGEGRGKKRRGGMGEEPMCCWGEQRALERRWISGGWAGI